MFVGHVGLAFAAKRAVPTASLGTLLLAALLADLLWPILVLARLESFQIRIGATAILPIEFLGYPYSHSLLALAFWGVVLAGVRAAIVRSRLLPSLTLAALVISHWFLDVIAHTGLPVSPVAEGGVGLGLWRSLTGTLLVEGALLAAGVAVYARSTWGVNRVGTLGLWLLAAAFVGAYLAIVLAPVPQSHATVLWGAIALWLFVLVGYLVDANRTVSLRRDVRAPAEPVRAVASSHVRRKRATARGDRAGRL